MFYVISVGENNRYGHPSVRVLKELMNNHNIIHIVSESNTSIFIENGIY